MRIDSKIISDGMVIQRGRSITLSGDVKNDGVILVKFQNRCIDAKSHNRLWSVTLNDLEAGGPYELVIVTPDEKRVIRDVLVGDVYFMSGQSNMELDIRWVYHHDREEIDAFESGYIRQFKVPVSYDFTKPLKDTAGGKWIKALGDDKLSFGAIGFFMAKQLYRKHGVPIGLIQTAVCGCPIESFLSKEHVLQFQQEIQLPEACVSENEMKEYLKKEQECLQARENRIVQEDEKLFASKWEPCTVPFLREETDYLSGCYWFKKEIELTDEAQLEEAVLKLGLIIDADYTYVNGSLVGYSSYQYLLRRYEIPSGVLKKGINEILVQVIVKHGVCRFWEGQIYELEAAGKKHDLSGAWQYRRGYFERDAFSQQTFFEYLPTGVYNAMLHPLMGYNVSALLWYQGEANTGDPCNYFEKFKVLIEQFREEMGIKYLPVYYIQLDEYKDPADPIGENWKILRKEQEKAQIIKNAFMIQAKKYGDPTDLHPQNKKGIGEEIASHLEEPLHDKDNDDTPPRKRSISCGTPITKGGR